MTGGSRGLGLALAREFAKRGHDVVIVARTEAGTVDVAEKLAKESSRMVTGLGWDVAHPRGCIALDDLLAARGFYIDVLINNAGIGAAGPFSEADPRQLQKIIDVNVSALTELTRHVLPQMRARRQGRILNVASLGGAVPGPGQAIYYASKAYVLSLTEAVAVECAGEGVRIAVLAPGPLDTSFHAAMGAERSLYRLLLPAVSLDRVARAAYWGLALGRVLIVPGVLNRLIYGALRILPHPVSVAFTEMLLRRR